MDNIETLLNVSKTVMEEPTDISVDIAAKNWLHEKLQNTSFLSKWFPKRRTFIVHPAKLGTLVRISKLLLKIGIPPLTKENFLQVNYEIAENHGSDLAMIIALAIHNKKSKPSKKLHQLILNEFTPKEIFGVVAIVLKAMDLTSFTLSITSIRGMNVLEMKSADADSASKAEVSPMEPTS